VAGTPKYRGEDNRTVLTELLGFDNDRIDQLEADGVLSSRIPATIQPSAPQLRATPPPAS
jgi:hypothetical protein